MGEHSHGKMGFWMTSALVVGTIIGAGIFMLPVSLAPLGRNAIIGWIVSGVGAVAIAFALSRFSRFGGEGIQANIEREFGPTVAFLTAWAFWVSNWVAEASIAVAAGSTVAFMGLSYGSVDLVLPVGILSVVVMTAINAYGVRASGSFSIVTVAIRILPLLAVVWLLLARGAHGGTFEPLAPKPVNFANLATATAMTFFALTGFESATTPVGKIHDAPRIIPRALIGGTIFVLVLYVLAGTSIQLLLPANVVATSKAPFADALVSSWGHGAASLAALAIAVSAIGCINCLILGTGELGYAMALKGDLPAVMARTRGANTPVVAQIVQSAMAILLLLANSSRATANLYTFIILLSTAAVIVVYFVGALAAWRMSASMRSRTIIAVALLFAVFAMYGTGLEADLWCLVLLAAGLAIRTVVRRLNSRSLAGSNPLAEAIPVAPPGSSS